VRFIRKISAADNRAANYSLASPLSILSHCKEHSCPRCACSFRLPRSTARRLVYGLATAETEDRAGEICDYASTKPLYEKWSEEIAKSTRGKSRGNLRAMHGPVAAGKVTAITFNDAGKQIEICAKVVDDAEWAKVVEGVYTGFSQGGAYERRWTDGEGFTRYTAAPNEISLVDLPCLPQFAVLAASDL
jgi:hypothetical protein